jgi:cell division protein FtsI (penicillin-binding protein 3)
MKRMLEEVVLKGTASHAILDGYSSAGKTGTAQKINPLTHRYGSKDIASFSGFAPVNNPAITVTVILDSPVGAHHGGDVGAPLFNRIAQQVLEYMDVPHDVDVRNPRRALLRASLKRTDTGEGSPDHIGEEISPDDRQQDDTSTVVSAMAQPRREGIVASSYRSESGLEGGQTATAPTALTSNLPPDRPLPATGTVVLDVGAARTVPSFIGKPVRAVIEQSQEAGVEVDIFGSGIARQQNPLPGTRLPSGGHVTVQFAR